MFVHTGGGGKGIRPNQHSQQQQQQQQVQQQQQQHLHQNHHHQSQQQQQLQAGSVVHHTSQTSTQQSSGNSHPHPHQQQQQPVAQHQQHFPHHQVPLTFFPYSLSQIHPAAATQHQHPGQNSVGNNVGGAPQMAPSPPIHTSGNGNQQQGNTMSGINNTTAGNNCNNPNNMGGNRQQSNNSNSLSHYAPGSALMQASLPPPNNNHFMTSAYQLQLQQQNAAVMVAAQYNSVAAAAAAAAGQHGNPGAGGGGQAGHALYQTTQQTQPQQTHQQPAIHSGQTTLHYFPNPAVSAAHAPTQLHHPPQHHPIRNVIAAVAHPRQPFLLSQGNYFTLSHATLPPPTRTSLLTNAHQQPTSAAASGVGGTGGSTVHVATQLQNTANRPNAATGPTTYVTPPFCTPPLQMGAGPTLATQPATMLAAATGIGQPPTLQATYGHLSGLATASTSTSSLNIQSIGNMGVGTSSSTGTEYKGTKPRKHAIPIIDPITLEKVTFDEPQKRSTAIEVKPPPPPLPTAAVDNVQSQSKTRAKATTETETGEIMENDKSITVSVASAPSPSASLTPPSPPATSVTKDKVDQQMQTDAPKEKEITLQTISITTTPQSLQTGESLQTCIEDPDDTDADTNEHELDNEDGVIDDTSLEQRSSASYIDSDVLTTDLNVNQEKIFIKDLEVYAEESDTENHTKETEVKSKSQIDDDNGQCKLLDAKDEELAIEPMFQKQDTPHIIPKITSQISSEKNVEGLEVKAALNNKDYVKNDETDFKMTLQNKKQDPDKDQLPSLSATYKNEQKNIKTTSSINVTTTKNKEQMKSIKTANTVINSPASNSGNLKNSKQNHIAAVTQKQNTTNTESNTGKTNQQIIVQNTLASGCNNSNSNNNNNNSFITVGKSKNRKVAKRSKENQKKSQQQHQHHQQQQQKFQEPSSSSATACNQRSSNSATSKNNISNKNSNNNTNLSLSSNAATNILLTDIHNANNSSISSSISGNLREQNKQNKQNQHHHQQQQQQQTSKSNNNNSSNRNSGVGPSKGMDSKNETENQRKHVKTQEIAQLLQPTTLQENSKVQEQQLQFLNSSSSTCEDEEEKLSRQEQSEQQQDLDAAIDVHFGDFKEHEKLIDTKVMTVSSKGSQNKQKNLLTDTVDSSSNLPTPHTRGGVAAPIHPKSHKGHHNIAPTGAGTVHKHKAAKQQHHQPLIRYSLEQLKALAVSPQSQKTPVVPCLRNDYVSQLFVSDLQQQYLTQHGGGGVHNIASTNLQLQQQYQHMNFNESMEFVTGKRRGGGQTRKHYDQHSNAGNSNSNINTILPGSSTGNSASGIAGQFPRKMEVIRIHLSLNEEIKLSECENAWQPEPLRSKSNNTSPSTGPNDDIDAVLKKVRGILNKLTPDNFEVLLKTMTSISMNSHEKMQQVMLLIFEKTVSEPNFAPTYAKFCKVLFQEIKPESKKIFNASLINRIQTEFEVNVNDADAKKLKLQPLVDKMEATTDAKERNELQAEIEDQEYQFRRRAWGTVRFIGEMYKLQSLSSDRVLKCIESLLEHGSEEKLEYMCKLLTTVGHLLEGNGPEHYGSNLRMDEIFRKIKEIVNETKATAKSSGGNSSSSMGTNAKTGMQTKISSRVRFMMQDVMDLRSRNWDQVVAITTAPKYGAPQTQANASGSQQQQQQQHQQHRRHRQQDDKNNQSSGSSSGNYERSGPQRGYANNQRPSRLMQQDMRESGPSSGGNYFMQKPLKSQFLAQQEQQSIDLKKLNFSRGDDSSQTTTKLGNSSTYMWRTSGRQTPQQNTTTSSLGITTSQYFGSKGQQGSNSMNTRNSFKRQTSNQFQVLSSSRDTEQQSTDMEKSSVSASSSSNNDNASDDDKSYSSKDNQKLLNHLIEEFLDCLSSHSDNWQNEILTTWQTTTQKQQISVVYFLLMDYLHLAAVKKLQRNACATIFSYLLRCKAFDRKTFARAYKQFAEEFPDLLVDVPNGWTYVFEFLGPILHERLLNFSDIWQPSWREDRHFTERFVIALTEHFTKEFGANYIRDLWHNEYKLDRGQLFVTDQQQWREFIQKNKLQYIYDCKLKPPQTEIKNSRISPASSTSSCSLNSAQEQQVKRLEMLLKTANDCDLAIDYINTNVNVNNNFLRNLTQFLCCDYATTMINTSASSTATTTTISSSSSSSNSSSNRSRTNTNSKKNNDVFMNTSAATSVGNRPHLNVDLFRKNCLPLLRFCLDAQEDYEITCLDAVVDSIQQYHDINTANELICSIFDILYDCEVIAKESFEKWYRQRQQPKQNENTAASKNKVNNNYKNPLTGHLQQYMQKLL